MRHNIGTEIVSIKSRMEEPRTILPGSAKQLLGLFRRQSILEPDDAEGHEAAIITRR